MQQLCKIFKGSNHNNQSLPESLALLYTYRDGTNDGFDDSDGLALGLNDGAWLAEGWAELLGADVGFSVGEELSDGAVEGSLWSRRGKQVSEAQEPNQHHDLSISQERILDA